MALFTINTISASKFSVNGREMFKTFTPVYLNESTISVSNIYDSTQFLFRNINVSDVEVDSVIYANATLLVTALVPVIFIPQGEGSFSQAQIDQNTADILALQTNKADVNHNHNTLYYLKTEIDSMLAGLPTGESIASGQVVFSDLIFYNATNVELFRVDCTRFLEQGTNLTFSNGLLSLKNDYNVELSNVNLNIQTLAYDDFVYTENIALDYSNLLYTNDFILVKNINNDYLFLSKLNLSDSRLFFDFAIFKTDLTITIDKHLDWFVYEIDLTGLSVVFIESVLYRFDFRLQQAESIINKQNNLDVDGNGIKYPTVDAVNSGLDSKVNISDLPSNLFFYPTTTPADVIGYFKLVNDLNDPDYDNPAVDVSTGAISTTNQLVSSLVSDAGILTGNPGIVNLTVVGNIKKVSGTGSAEFYFEAYHRDSLGVETLVGTSNNTQVVTNSTYEQFSATLLWNDGNFDATDRVVLKFYANKIGGGSNPSYNFQFGGANPVRAIFPVSFYLLAGDYELKANKQNDLTVDGTGVKFPTVDAINTALITKADLVAGKVPSSQLPSYVDDVLEFANLGAFPLTGETGKLYLALDTEKLYRWTGSVYVEISAGVTSHSQLTLDDGTNPHGTTKSDVGLANVDNTSDLNKPISTATQTALNDKEDTSNKATTMTGNTASNTLFLTAKAIYDWAVGLFQPILVSGTTLKTVKGISLLGSGDVPIVENATHTGDVTGSMTLTITNNAVTTEKISDYNVTLTKLTQMDSTSVLIGKYPGAIGSPQHLNTTDVKSILGLSNVTNNAQWNLQGNAGTNPATDFIGTTDAQDFRIRTNNVERIFIGQSGRIGINQTYLGNSFAFNLATDQWAGIRVQKSTNDSIPSDITLVKSRGDLTTPLAVNSADRLGAMFVNGHNGTNFGSSCATIAVFSTEAFTPTAQGCSIRFETTANGTTTRAVRMLIDQNGNIGIGTITPTKTFDINGELRIRTLPTGLSTENILVVNGSGDVRSIASSTFQLALTNPITGTGATGQVSFFNGTNTQTGDNSFFWDNTNKRLGIGTSSPSTIASITTSGEDHLHLSKSTANANDNVFICFSHNNSTASSNTRARIGVNIKAGGAGSLVFHTGAQGAVSERVRIDELGNVGMGTNLPTKTLDVNGEVRIRTLPVGLGIDTIVTANGTGEVRGISSSTFYLSTNPDGYTNNLGTVTSVDLASGTTGTDINISGSPITTNGTITLNIPTASAINRGALSNTDWTTFNGKQDGLISGTNIKTINGSSVLGSGDLIISGGGATYITADADLDFLIENDTIVTTVLNASITNANLKAVSFMPIETTETSLDDFSLNGLQFNIENIIDGVSFDIRARANQNASGIYRIKYLITI